LGAAGIKTVLNIIFPTNHSSAAYLKSHQAYLQYTMKDNGNRNNVHLADQKQFN